MLDDTVPLLELLGKTTDLIQTAASLKREVNVSYTCIYLFVILAPRIFIYFSSKFIKRPTF